MDRARAKRRERGYVLFTMAAAMITICAFAGLVTDVGYAAYVRRQAQAAADAGAKAGALEILAHQNSSISAAAKADTANNGFTDQVGNVTVTVNNPPLSGSYSAAAANKYVEVIVTKTISTNFMAIVGFPTITISARGVGGGGGGGACIYALAGTDSGLTNDVQDAILASGGGTNINAGCGIIDESTHSKGIETSGGATMTGSSIQVVGNYNGTGFTPTPTTGITSPGDPFSGQFTAPTPASCTATSWHNNSATLSPGTYCGGIVVDSNNTVTASAGMYILYGGGLTVSGGGNLIGSGVTFFNMDSGGSYGGYKPIVVSGGSTTSLSAPTSGSYEGLLFWQDPSLPSTDYNKQNTVSGGSSTQFNGILYFPDSPLVYSGGSGGSSQYTVIVAATVTFSGGSTLHADYSSLSGGNPIKTTAIIAE
jgi:hypothetical protein